LRLLYVLLITLLPLAALGFVALGLPELADGVGEFGGHGVIAIATAHQILSQPALILFHCPISLSKVPLVIALWPSELARYDSTRSLVVLRDCSLLSPDWVVISPDMGVNGAQMSKNGPYRITK
jgi:hypothetical protein